MRTRAPPRLEPSGASFVRPASGRNPVVPHGSDVKALRMASTSSRGALRSIRRRRRASPTPTCGVCSLVSRFSSPPRAYPPFVAAATVLAVVRSRTTGIRSPSAAPATACCARDIASPVPPRGPSIRRWAERRRTVGARSRTRQQQQQRHARAPWATSPDGVARSRLLRPGRVRSDIPGSVPSAASSGGRRLQLRRSAASSARADQLTSGVQVKRADIARATESGFRTTASARPPELSLALCGLATAERPRSRHPHVRACEFQQAPGGSR